MRTEVKLEADRLAEALRERVENLQGGGAPQAMAKACQIVLRTAKRYAPKDTGLLRRSLTYRVVREGEDIVGQVGTNVHYAIHVEYGHRTRASKNAIGKMYTRYHALGGNGTVTSLVRELDGLPTEPR